MAVEHRKKIKKIENKQTGDSSRCFPLPPLKLFLSGSRSYRVQTLVAFSLSIRYPVIFEKKNSKTKNMENLQQRPAAEPPSAQNTAVCCLKKSSRSSRAGHMTRLGTPTSWTPRSLDRQAAPRAPRPLLQNSPGRLAFGRTRTCYLLGSLRNSPSCSILASISATQRNEAPRRRISLRHGVSNTGRCHGQRNWLL